jgi:hypothetical protein
MCVVSCLDGLLNMTLFGKESYLICTAKCGNVRFGLFSFADNYVMCIGLLLNYWVSEMDTILFECWRS